MTPEIKTRIDLIRRGEVPEGFIRKRKSIVPKGWKICQIRDVATVSSGSTPNRSHSEYWNGGIPWVTTGELESVYIVKTNETISDRARENLKLRMYPAGTVLMAMYGQGKTRGTVAILGMEATVNQACAAISVKAGNPQFVLFALQNAYNDIRRLSNTGNQENLNADIIKTHSLSWPPISEQQKIVEILTTQDKIIELKEKRLAEKQQQKKYLMQQLLTGEKRISGFSNAWRQMMFSDAFTFMPTNTLSRENLCDDHGSALNIHYGDILIKYSEVLRVDATHIPYIKKTVEIPVSAYVKDGDLIIADTAEDYTVGKAVEIRNLGEMKVVSGLHTILCRPMKGIFAPGWLGYYINSPAYHNQLISLICGVKVCSISKREIKKTVLIVPEMKEQMAIVDIFAEIDRELNLLKQDIIQERRKKKALMQLLLTGIVRVNT